MTLKGKMEINYIIRISRWGIRVFCRKEEDRKVSRDSALEATRTC